MPISRRDLVKSGIIAATATAMPRPLLARLGPKPEPVPPIDDPRLKTLVARALEAARAAGATYADVRLTHDRLREIRVGNAVRDSEVMVVGVRALVDGYWGFVSGPVWSPDELARLGREAAALAKTNALGKSRIVELAPAPAIREGHWVTPIKVNPFDVPPVEISDFIDSLKIFTLRTPGTEPDGFCAFSVQAKAFGSTDGSYVTQRRHLTWGEFAFRVNLGHGMAGAASLDSLAMAGVGWELFRDQPLREQIRRALEEIKEEVKLPVKPIDVGRYDTVFDARSVADLIDVTLGRGTELDRALGYEANAGGTSYLNEPLEMLGSYEAGAPLLTVTANRSEAGGCATVKWDDEGVAPEDFTLVKDGVLVDFQTTRESATWLKPYYAKSGTPVRSRGCAAAPSALYAPYQHRPNIALTAGREAMDFDGLVAGLTTGIAIRGAKAQMDFQCLNGLGLGRAYEVKRGKRVAVIANAGFLFGAPELWKGLLALGGQASVRRVPVLEYKGQPASGENHSVTAPPALFKQVTFIDPMRRA